MSISNPNLIGAEQPVYWLNNRAIGKSMNERATTIIRTKDGDYFYPNRNVTFRFLKREIVSWGFESEST